MFAELLKRLTQSDQIRPLPDEDARLALSALLVRIARADGDYAAEEVSRIDRILMQRYGLSPHGVIALRKEAEALESEAPDTVRFTRAIKDAVPYEERLGVIEALWQVALADGARDGAEDALVRMVSSMLGVSDQDSAVARQRMQGGA
ncbi:MAG: TerB family tellurite resistance protein [Rhodobacterales bacterium]|nr:TerB family tellurite resistance protein [Rhodobacterales bacterium]MDX5412567.1 TerB family tellurite resistance protein [Rhodobacterales bacterium]